jgi:hypothetical protein
MRICVIRAYLVFLGDSNETELVPPLGGHEKTAVVETAVFLKVSGFEAGLLLRLGGGLLGGRGGGVLAFMVGDAALLLDDFVGLLAHRF